MKRVLRAALLISAFVSSPALATDITGTKLLEMLSAKSDGSKDSDLWAGFTAGYIRGILDAQDLAAADDLARTKDGKILRSMFCFPPTTPRTEVLPVVKRWLQEHPSELSGQAPNLVKRAMVATWPCQK